MEQTPFSLESAIRAELEKDVKLKNGQVAIDAETGQPLKAQDAIAKSIMSNAMRGDIGAVMFIRNITRPTDPAETQRRREQYRQRLEAETQRMRAELEADGLWCGQQVELERVAEVAVSVAELTDQMHLDGYQDLIQEMKKDGTTVTRLNPLRELRDKYAKQLTQDYQALRADALRRQQMKRMMG